MKISYAFLAMIFLILFARINAQVIPDSLRTDWSQAGYKGTIPNPSLIINVKDFGAYGDGVHDDYNAIINAINSSTAFRVIYFPSGIYLIKSSIAPPNNIVFRGEGTATNLIFDLAASGNKDAFNISNKQTSAFTVIDSGYNKGSAFLKLSTSSGFTAGSFAEIREANGAWNTVPADWANYSVGQIVQIKAVNGNRVIIDPALRIDYTSNLQPEIRPVTLKTNVGIECLKITRTDTIINNKYGYNIDFNYAANCWVTGIESNKSQASHVMLSSCKNISVSGCYFHDAFTYDGTSTAGYGVTMIQHNSDCKVENCIFKHLRHPMVAKQGANGNIFAYNYSLDPYRSEDPHDAGGDMLLHGHYPFANLFEGNIGESIIVDHTWGPAGPYNTFFRNRADLYGIVVFDQSVNSYNQNIVGNEVTNTDSLKGNYYLQASNHFTFDNNIKGTIQPAGTGNLSDSSYYLKAKPYFWNAGSAWPSIGGVNVLNSGTNPAKERYFSGESKTSCLKEPSNLQVTFSADSIQCNGGTSKITISATGGSQPYQGTGVYYKPSGSYVFVVTDALGNSDSAQINLMEPAPITASINTTASQSCKQNGSIYIKNISGGHKPYFFSLNNLNYISDSVFKNLASGAYTVWIKDSAGCIDSNSNNSIVNSIPAIIISAKTTQAASCVDDGSITLKRTGGTSPFQYSINNSNYVTANIFYSLAGGNYTAWVKDKTGCADSLKNIIVGRAAALKASVQKVNVSCKRGSDGKITIKASGGTKPYLYSLDSINYTSDNVFINLSSGTYKCWVKDAKACNAFVNAVIIDGKITCSSAFNTELNISVLPNPSAKEFILTANSSSKKEIQFVVMDIYGRKIYSSNGSPNKLYRFGNNFIPGVYVLKLMQGKIFKTYKIIKQ